MLHLANLQIKDGHRIVSNSFSDGTWADLTPRLLTIAIGAPVLIGAMLYGSPAFDVVMLTIAGIVVVELHRMVAPSHHIGLALMFGMATAVIVPVGYMPASWRWALLLLALLSIGSVLVSRQQGHSLRVCIVKNTVSPFLMSVYIALPIALLVVLRETETGRLWISLLVWVTWFTDSWALLGGRVLGRTPLAPRISPGKTVEGALTGIGFGVAAGTTIVWMLAGGWQMGAGLSLVIAVMTIAGDLLASAIKRYFKVKDASGLLPGHGGFLDRMDSFLVSTPVFFGVLVVTGLAT